MVGGDPVQDRSHRRWRDLGAGEVDKVAKDDQPPAAALLGSAMSDMVEKPGESRVVEDMPRRVVVTSPALERQVKVADDDDSPAVIAEGTHSRNSIRRRPTTMQKTTSNGTITDLRARIHAAALGLSAARTNSCCASRTMSSTVVAASMKVTS